MSERLRPGVVIDIAPGVRRIVAPNPSMMTGPGTNTYIVGATSTAVIDPGPAIDAHIESIAAVARIDYIIATHTHPDHSPATAKLAQMTGAQVIGLPAPAGAHQDRTFKPHSKPLHGDRLIGHDFTLRFVHTPGHASNHLCVLHEAHRMLFTGDHIMNGSTVVIDPPDGNMGDYLRSLRGLLELDLDAIAPGHGELIDEPATAINWLIDHRLMRERKVREAVTAFPGFSTGELVSSVYRDVPVELHRLAERSLLAHLIKLQEDGEVSRIGERWHVNEA